MEGETSTLDVLHSKLETDRQFYQALRFLPDRAGALARHHGIVATMLALIRADMNRESRTNVTYTATIPINLPAGWNDPVVVRPSAAEIRAATRTHTATPVDLNCSICQEGITEPGATRIIECGHLFHPNCISEWFTRSVHCPMCRYDIRGVSQNVPTSFETTDEPLPASSLSDGWLVGVDLNGHTADTEESDEHHA